MREDQNKPRKKKARESEKAEPVVGRPFWSGTISFGLVSIPVNLFPANRDSRVSFKTLGPNGEPLKRDYYAPETGEELNNAETVRGFQTSTGKVVTVTEEELERLAPEKSRDINLRVFVARNNISPLYFERGFILTPADNSGKAYRLLAEIMESSKRAGIATFVMRGKEYLVAILAVDGILRVQTLRFADEVRKPSGIGLPRSKKPNLSAARKFHSDISRLTKKSLNLSEMRDEDSERVLKFIEKKRAKHRDVVESEPSRKGPAEVVDLMEILKKNLGQSQKTH